MKKRTRAIQLSPDYLPAHIQLGEVLAKQGRHEAAASKFFMLGETYKARQRYQRRGEFLRTGIRADASGPLRAARLIDLLKRHGQIDRALEHYMAMGDTYYQIAQVDKARETYQDALRLAPRGEPNHQWKVKVLRAIADIDMQRFQWQRALPAVRELRELDPENEWTAITLIDLYF
ncbi:MAG: hypothetical protein M5U34_12060 [Chloroflexi bacterium]|nr:hypothetical protein [Chloroflexota bacterium]